MEKNKEIILDTIKMEKFQIITNIKTIKKKEKNFNTMKMEIFLL